MCRSCHWGRVFWIFYMIILECHDKKWTVMVIGKQNPSNNVTYRKKKKKQKKYRNRKKSNNKQTPLVLDWSTFSQDSAWNCGNWWKHNPKFDESQSDMPSLVTVEKYHLNLGLDPWPSDHRDPWIWKGKITGYDLCGTTPSWSDTICATSSVLGHIYWFSATSLTQMVHILLGEIHRNCQKDRVFSTCFAVKLKHLKSG